MTWSDLAEDVAGWGLPLLGTALGGPAGGAVGGMIAKALGVEPKPEVLKALSPTQAMKDRLAELETRNQYMLERLSLEGAIANVREVNETFRREIASSDPYVRRMRPTFGYVMAAVIFGLAAIGGYAVIAAPQALPSYAQLVGVLNLPLGAGLAVLGVYVHQRSREKATDAGHPPPRGLLSAILDR